MHLLCSRCVPVSIGRMSVKVLLDKPHSHFTNLDFISGRIILNLSNDEAISSITVKLEGESKTRLAGPKSLHNDGQGGRKTELEIHKILYNLSEVFPSEEIKKQTSSTTGYTLRPGQHEYAFRFKLPFNNNCYNTNGLFSNLNFSGVRVEIARDTDQHVKKTLPPTLTGFPGEAEIRYYVKVTVVRPRFYQENYRAQSDFIFLPIEPPRPPDTKEETYARRQHQFSVVSAPPRKKKGLLDAFRTPSPPPTPSGPPTLGIDIRLPNPPIITCNEPLPLRILIRKLAASSEPVYLQMLQIELIAFTKIRAHDLRATEYGSWVILSLSNMRARLGNPTDKVGTELVLDNKYWKDLPLPNTVAPSFETCNISRSYELEVRIGLTCGPLSNARPEFIVLPLRHPVQVYSGIAPPPALLAAMARHKTTASSTSKLSVNTGLRPPSHHPTWHAETPVTPSYVTTPPRLGEHAPPPQPPQFSATAPNEWQQPDAAPPSYEDAMAEDIGPVDGHRRDYRAPNVMPGASSKTAASSGGGGPRQDSDRLFPDTEPR